MFKTIALIFLVFGAFCSEAKEVLDNFDLVHKYEYIPMKIMKSLYMSKTEKASWAKSHDICKSFGMELATFDIPNEAERLLVNYRLLSTQKPDAWVGYTDENHEGVWTSNNGKLMDENISFHDGEPNNKFGVEHCLSIALFHTNEHKFNDLDCNIILHIICEQKTAISYVDELKENLEKQRSEFSMMNSEMNAKMDSLKTENIGLKNKLKTLENSCEMSNEKCFNCINMNSDDFCQEMFKSQVDGN